MDSLTINLFSKIINESKFQKIEVAVQQNDDLKYYEVYSDTEYDSIDETYKTFNSVLSIDELNTLFGEREIKKFHAKNFGTQPFANATLCIYI